jgi:hypothetical protein
VRVDPLELHHRTLDLDRLVAVELGRERVVGERRTTARQHCGCGENGGTPGKLVHRILLYVFAAARFILANATGQRGSALCVEI